eukprot:TRINITY_DN2419_c0_g1_i1.p2 TRINITY_DN2419_c0_g1~~TRINITY_DN2419_c0_g1_i1.p2  ORF type:complete len:63 (-),score=5.48 TRINITY_DN2419_c0_g1_i1:19-207(-)
MNMNLRFLTVDLGLNCDEKGFKCRQHPSMQQWLEGSIQLDTRNSRLNNTTLDLEQKKKKYRT